ncbi:MAG TPA: phosphopantothenoylcysteine decarboxylase [Anaerohalosphaeraceae bacterium]|nr:phosphopantothenoylcysteine decarboxylase [Anaerohalosphaeraceae bacterium]
MNKNGKKMRFLITAGGTREYLDPVRYITNASSGRMGYALAAAAMKAGHSVTLISAPTSLVPPTGAEVVSVVSAGDMFKAVKKHFKTCDCLIMAAAVSDYTPVEAAKVKRKKEKKVLTLKLKPTEDILTWAGQHKKQHVVVGFALEDRNLKHNAEKKLISKNADMIVANSPAAIGADSSRVLLKTPQWGWIEIAGNKAKTARAIIRHITSLILR